MQRALRTSLTGLVLTVLLAVSALAAGFAQRMSPQQQQAIAVAALAGQDISDICAGQAGDIHGTMHCAGCHLGDGATVPVPVSPVRDAQMRLVAEVGAPNESRAIRTPRDPAHGLRAPPAV